MAGLIEELKRRNVFKVGMAYLALAWLVIEVTDAAVPALNLPESLNSIVFYIGLIGFPFALFFSWAFELTTEGVKRESEESSAESLSSLTGHNLNRITIAILLMVLAFVIVDQYIVEERDNVVTQNDAAENRESAALEQGVPTDRERSIAVLPFRNRSAVEDDQYFVDGIHDDILTLLTRVSAFDKVISRTSVERYRNTTQAIPEIARELGVTIVLEGGVQRAGDRVRINMQLIDSATDEHLWAETYDREMTLENIFEIQSEVAKSIVTALEASLSPEELVQIDKRPTDNLQAMELYFKGLERIARSAEGDASAAKEYFERAVSIDPGFAAAWAQLAYRYMSTSFENADLRKPYMEKAYETVNHALSLDPDLGEAHLAKAVLYLVQDDITDAEAAVARARELIPNSPHLFFVLGNISTSKGDVEQALVYQSMGRERGGIPFYLGMGDPLLFVRKFDEARDNYQQLIELSPDSPVGYWGMSASFWIEGQLHKAVPWARKAYAKNRNFIRNPALHFAHAWLFWDLEDDAEGFCWAQRMFDMEPEDFDNNELMMIAWIIRGDHEKTLHFAQRSRQRMVNNAMQVGPRPYTLSVLRDEALANGDVTQIRRDYETMFPQLFVEGPLDLNLALVAPLADVVPVLRATGEKELEHKLLQAGFEFMKKSELAAIFIGADLLTFVGKYDEALDLLSQLAQLGGFAWRQIYELNGNLAPLRQRPEFQLMIKQLREKMQVQRGQLKDLEQAQDTCLGAYLGSRSSSM